MTDDLRRWRVLRCDDARDSPWSGARGDEVELPDGSHIDYLLAEQRDVACVLALTPIASVRWSTTGSWCPPPRW